jgi:hypothetical protein
MHIARVNYLQSGSRYLERSTYWFANGTGALTVNGVPLSYSFTEPTLTRTVDLTGQGLESTTISVSLQLRTGRSGNFPRVTAPPGSASIRVISAVIQVEFEAAPPPE